MNIHIIRKSERSHELNGETKFQGTITKGDHTLCLGMPICKDIHNLEEFEKVVSGSDNYRIRPFIDGTLIRVFYDHEHQKWVISTNCVIDAYKSYWKNKVSFGKMYEECIKSKFQIERGEFEDTLNKEYRYYFLISHTESLYPLRITSNEIYEIQVLDKNGDHAPDKKYNNFKPVPMDQLSRSKEELVCDIQRGEISGIVIENKDHRYCWFSDFYIKKKENYESIFNGSIGQNILKLDSDQVEALKDDYPDIEIYDAIMKNVRKHFLKQCHIEYIRRYVQKNFREIHPSIHHFIKRLHTEYFKNYQPITPEIADQVFQSLDSESKFIYLKPFSPKVVGGYKQ
jgi:hypothetical protein